MDILERLMQLQEKHEWSEYRLSRECGLPQSTVSTIFRRNTMPSVPTLEAICKGFGITMSQFFAENEMVELNDDLKILFNNWVTLTPEQKLAVLKLIENMH